MSAQQILVLGAGMVGVSIAWHLRSRGCDVVLVDRRKPGHETSYGNAGLIQREAVAPHPFPRQISEILRVLPNLSIDIRYQWLAMLEEAGTLWKFWRYSAPGSFAHIIPEYASLIEHCTADHQTLIDAAGAEDLIRRNGWLQVYRTEKALATGLQEATDARDHFGVTFDQLDSTALHNLEPHLTDRAIAAIHWTNSWAVTAPGKLVQAYAADYYKRGGTFIQAEVK